MEENASWYVMAGVKYSMIVPEMSSHNTGPVLTNMALPQVIGGLSFSIEETS
jgi:hypothetical protein